MLCITLIGSTVEINNFTNLVERQLKKAKSRDLIITHYHFDHYSLLGKLPSNFFDNIYIPALPRESTTAQAMEMFLALAIVTGYEKYYLIPMILSRGKNIRCLVKNESFDAIGRDWEVLWPDYQIIDKPAFSVAGRSREFSTNVEQNMKDIGSWCGEFMNSKEHRSLKKFADNKSGSVTGGITLGICFKAGNNDNWSYAIAVELPEGKSPSNYEILEIPATKWAVFQTTLYYISQT